MIQRYLFRRVFRRAYESICYQLETSWLAIVALYAAMFAVLFAINY